MSTLLVLTNLPDRATAEKLADRLLEERVAACVNILAPCRSVYRWKGAVQHDEEHPMLIKTTRERYPALEQVLRAGRDLLFDDLVGEKQVAACVNILAPCRSVYRWKGAVQHDEEH